MQQLIIVSFVFTYLFFCSTVTSVAEELDKSADRVSLIKLIANPDKFNNKRVQTFGVVYFAHESSSIFLTYDDYKNYVTCNGLKLNLSNDPDMYHNQMKKYSKYNGKYVIIEGTFLKPIGKNSAHRACSGNLMDIDWLSEWKI
jgi:hypothetical protein